MDSTLQLVFVVCALFGAVLGQTPSPEIKHDTSRWVQRTEPTAKPTTHFWSSTSKRLRTTNWHLPVELDTTKGHLPVELDTTKGHLPVELGTTKGHLPVELDTTKGHLPVELGTTKGHLPVEKHTSINPELTVSDSTNPKQVTVPEKNEFLTTASANTTVPEHSSEEDLCEMALELQEMTYRKLEELEEQIERLSNATIHKIQKPCRIQLSSVSYVGGIPNQSQMGGILVNGRVCRSCIDQTEGRNDIMPGLATCVIDPVNCEVVEHRRFKTSDSSDTREAEYLTKYLEEFPKSLTLAGASCGDAINGMGDASKIWFRVMNVDLDEVDPYDKFVFLVQGKAPHKGRVETDRNSLADLKAVFQMTGDTVDDYWYEKVIE